MNAHSNTRQVTPLEPYPWISGIDGYAPEAAEGRVDFDNDEGRTVATVRITANSEGYTVHVSQLSDLDNLTIIHTND